MLRAIIVENEIDAYNLLKSLVEEFIPRIMLVGHATSIKTAKNLIESLSPELIFLDIELDDGNAFELLDSMPNLESKIIFTTAYNQFALDAFQYNTIDYLLKPYAQEEIIKAVNKLGIDDSNNFNSRVLEVLSTLR